MPSLSIDKTMQCSGGDGPPVVLLHGFGADSYSWLATAPELAKHAKVFTVELPGHGNAWDVPLADGLALLSEQIITPAINKAARECNAPVHLIGHSLGGALAMLATAHDSTQIASLSLIAPLGLGSGADADFIEKYVALDDETATLKLLQRTVFNERLISGQLIKPLLLHLGKDGVRATLQTLAQAVLNPADDLSLAVERISCSDLPRQVIWGMNDSIIPPVKDDEKRFGGYWHTLENCGHLPHIEMRVQVNRLLLDIVRRTTGV